MGGRLRSALACASALCTTLGCTFDQGGLRGSATGGVADDRGDGSGSLEDDGGDAPADTGGGEGSGGPGDDGLDPGGSSDGGTSGASIGDTGGEESTGPANDTGVPGNADLLVSDGPVFDFGPVGLGQQASHTFTVTNQGDAAASALGGVVSGDFAFVGGAYPGTAGTCASGLDPQTACTVVVAFAPGTPGEAAGAIRIDYVDAGVAALASVGLHAAGVGQTGNLLVNGNAEAQGNPPPGWSEANGDGWQTDNVKSPHGGAYCIFAGSGASNVDLELRQGVDLQSMANAIDAGTLRFSFSGWASAWSTGNDDYRIRVQYLGEQARVLQTYESDWGGSSTWQHIAGDQMAPVGARSVLVRLYCNKPSGDWCDAYYDDLSLVAAYP